MAENRTNGFRLSSWQDILSLAALVSMFLGVVAWGLKLESALTENRIESAQLGDELRNLKNRVEHGILPRAEERLEAHTRRFADLERRVNLCEQRTR